MQAAEALRERECDSTEAAGPARRAMPDAEIKRLFISLIDPTAMVRTDRCIRIAELIGAYSAGARWDQGIRLARLLAETYRDMSDIADRPIAGGAYWEALRALGDILAYLRKIGRAYRDGQDADPMEGIEEVRASVALIRKRVSGMKAEEPYSEPVDPDTPPELIKPKAPAETCRKCLMRSEWALRQRFKKWGGDYIFPPEPKSIAGLLAKYVVPGQTSLDMVREVRRRGRM